MRYLFLFFYLVGVLSFKTAFGETDNEMKWSTSQKFVSSEGKTYRSDMEKCLKRPDGRCVENLFGKAFSAYQAGGTTEGACQNNSGSYEEILDCLQAPWVKDVLKNCVKTELPTQSVQVGQVLCYFSRHPDGKIKINGINSLP